MHHALYFRTIFFVTLYVPCFPFFLIDRNQKQVLLIKRVIIFLNLKIIFFRSFQLFENHFRKVASKLINVMKLEVENNIIVFTLSNLVNINAEIDNVDWTLFNVVNFNVDIHNVVSTMI